MIISNLIGGLGNQMFQYAFGRALSLRTGSDYRLSIDLFDKYKSHNGPELASTFNISSTVADNLDLVNLIGWQAYPTIRKYIGRNQFKSLLHPNWVIEPDFAYHPEVCKPYESAYLHGYWQSERYFEGISKTLRNDFQFIRPLNDMDQLAIDEMSKASSVSLHVRRGDYCSKKNKSIYASLDVDYYRKAILFLQERVENLQVFAFSDDITWLETNLRSHFKSLRVIAHNRGLDSSNDMRLMSLPDHHIIANSSFSWWGAWLNPSPDKIVVAPSRWFVNSIPDTDIIPSTWTRL